MSNPDDPAADTPLLQVDAGGWGLTWAPDADGRLHQLGLGPEGHRATAEVDPVWYPDAHPTWGGPDPFRPPALRVTHADGTLTTRLRWDHVERAPEDGAAGVPTDELVTLYTVDELFPLRVRFRFRTHRASGVLEQWVEVDHDEDGPVTLGDYDSLALPLL
ncbi:MAG: glycoside hydrolase family 36 N-terminal domain-containing protein, partial [Microthrixaceae bacterium]